MPIRWNGDRRTCFLKVRYFSVPEARAAARKQSKKHGQRMLFYRCPVCDWWHLTRAAK